MYGWSFEASNIKLPLLPCRRWGSKKRLRSCRRRAPLTETRSSLISPTSSNTAATKPLPDPDAEEAPQEEAADAESIAEVADFLRESAYFEAVGVGVGRTETYYIQLALKQLASKPGISKVRFFGKFFGTQGNYYVFETNKQEEDQTESEDAAKHPDFGRPAEPVPPEKEGTNVYAYWVCSQLGEAFTQLPDVTPLQIKTARCLTKFLTGNLNEEVSAYPPFPGVEKNYLRAQIARISGTTILAPKGYFVAEELEEGEEPTGNIEKNEEWTMPSPNELGKLESWVHQNPHIKKQGRCSLYVPEPSESQAGSEEEGEEEASKAEGEEGEEAPEPSPELLSSVENDQELSTGNLKQWSVSFSSSVRGLKHQVVCVRSFLWPGAYTVATKEGFSNVYIGWGIKNSLFQPALPPDVQKEYEGDLVETLELPPVPEPEVSEEPVESEVEQEAEEGEEEEEE